MIALCQVLNSWQKQLLSEEPTDDVAVIHYVCGCLCRFIVRLQNFSTTEAHEMCLNENMEKLLL